MSAESIWDLLHAGDWACANSDEESLARVARTLALRLAGELRVESMTVAAVAAFDIGEASSRWGLLTDELRAQVSALSQ